MKKILKEQLERIHRLNYGSKVINEGFMDSLFGKKDEKKADVVEPDVQKFFDTLEQASQGNGISQQERGSMTFQKEVESMQIGLILLGYELPRFGVDGLFGPETAAAVTKFTSEKVGDKKSINEVILSSPIGPTSINSPFGSRGSGTHPGIDLKADSGTQVKSPLDGEVIDAGIRNNDCGGTIFIQHADGIRTRYCHCKQVNVNKGDIVKKGDVIGLSGGASNDIGRGRSDGAHLHFEVYKDGSLVDPEKYLGSEVGEFVSGGQKSMVTATPEMLKTLIQLLKERGVKASEIQQYTNIGSIDYTGTTDNEFYTTLLQVLQAPVTQENMKFLLAWRQAEGRGGLNNPFNTTWNLPGSTTMNSAGVRNYASAKDGLVATVKTLKNGRYDCILSGLRNDLGADRISQCESLKTWGTGDLVAKVVSSYNNGAKPNIQSLA